MSEPIKLHFTNEQLKRGIDRDHDDASYEAGSSHPEAPKLRFFIEHGVIHDRATGKHVRTDDTMHPHEDGIQEACVLLNSLAPPPPAGDMVLVPREALDWLFGQGPDAQGYWFGDYEDNSSALNEKRPAFWWRSKFRAMLAAAPLPTQEVSEAVVERASRAAYDKMRELSKGWDVYFTEWQKERELFAGHWRLAMRAALESALRPGKTVR